MPFTNFLLSLRYSVKIFNLGLNCNIYCFSPVLYLCNYNNREYLNSLKRDCRSVPRHYVFCLYMRHKIFTLIISFVTVSAIARVAPNTILPFCNNADSLETVERIDTSKNTAQLPKVVIAKNVRSVKLKDGSLYVGEMKGRRPHGNGKMTFPNGNVYTGSFVKGKMQGKGVYLFSDGERYEGEFHAGRQHGKGICYFVDGRCYDGN